MKEENLSENLRIVNDDCFNYINTILDNSVDLVLTDPPYHLTRCKWDVEIDFEKLWVELKRVGKDNCVYVFTTSQPFTTDLINSNRKGFKYEWIWFKNVPTGMTQARYAPMKYHESLVVFSKNPIKIFNKQMEERVGKGKDCYNYEHYCGESNHVKMAKVKKFYNAKVVNPSSVLLFNVVPNRKGKLHPTQKPVALMEYIVRTYTNEGDLSLDPFAGSFTTGIACLRLGRKFIGIEISEEYYNIGKKRIQDELINKIQTEESIYYE